jgi:hypothetical protein
MQFMEINFHLRNVDATGAARSCRCDSSAARDAQAAQEDVALENSRALTAALKNTPESRDDVVRRATELVGDVNYPPPETIRMISNLLAIQMHAQDQDNAPS